MAQVPEIVGLISVVILLVVSVKYNDLTKKYNKPTRLYTALGVMSYFLPFVVVDHLLHIPYTNESFSMTAAFISGSITSCALYFALKKTWADNDKNNPDILDDDMMI